MSHTEPMQPQTGRPMSAYADFSPLYADFIRKATEDDRCWAGENFDRTHMPAFMRDYVYLQRWPIVVTEHRHAELGLQAIQLVRALRNVVPDVFGSDLGAARRYFRQDKGSGFERMLEQPNGLDYCIARVDFALTDAGLRLLEFNLGPSISGWEVFLFERFYRTDPQLRWLFEHPERPLSTVNPLELMTKYAFGLVRVHFRDPSEIANGINIGFAVAAEDREHASELIDVLRHTMLAKMEAGAKALANRIFCFTADSQIECTGRMLEIDGVRTHAIIDLTHDASLVSRFDDAFKAGAVVMLNARGPVLLGSKSSVALLSETAGRGAFRSAADQEIVEALVPWTRRVLPDTHLEFRGDTGPVREILLRHQHALVLKPDNERSGTGVVIGPRASSAAWADTVDLALVSNAFVVQEYCAPSAFPGAAAGTVQAHDLVWSLFVLDERFAGSYVRMLPTVDTDGVVNASRGATEAIVFQHP